MARGGADHSSMEGAEEEKRGSGVSFSIRVGLCVIRLAVGEETREAGAYCPSFQKILICCSTGRQSSVRDTSCSVIMRRKLIKAYRILPRAVLMLTPVSSAMSLKLMPLVIRM